MFNVGELTAVSIFCTARGGIPRATGVEQLTHKPAACQSRAQAGYQNAIGIAIVKRQQRHQKRPENDAKSHPLTIGVHPVETVAMILRREYSLRRYSGIAKRLNAGLRLIIL
jgi:hypothetical protein